MTETEKAYMPGIIDVEGSIMLEKIHNNQYPSPVVIVTSTTLELLEWIKSKINKDKITKKTNYNIEKHKDCYTYVIRYNNATSLLEEVYPYLIIKGKKLRADMIINKYKSITPRNGRYTDELLELKKDFYNRFINIK